MSALDNPFPGWWECVFHDLPPTDQAVLRSARSFKRNIAQIIIRWAKEKASEAALLGQRLYLSDGEDFVIAKDVLNKVLRFVQDIEEARRTWRHTQTEHIDEFLDYCLYIITKSSLDNSTGADNLFGVVQLLRLFWLLETCRHSAIITKDTQAEDSKTLTTLYKHGLYFRVVLLVRGPLSVPGWKSTPKKKSPKKAKSKSKSTSKTKSKAKTHSTPSESDAALPLLLEQIKACCCRVPSLTPRLAECRCHISSPGLLYHPSISQGEAFSYSLVANTSVLSSWLVGSSGHDDTGLLRSSQYACTTNKDVRWLYSTSTFERWASASRSALLHIHGPVGCGKTYAVVDMIRSLRATGSESPYVSFCFCNNFMTRRDKPSAQSVFSNMLNRLLKLSDEPGKIHRAIFNYWSYGKAQAGAQSLKGVRLSDCVNIMLEMLEYGPMILFIDAIDELEAEERDLLTRNLEVIMHNAKNVLKIFVTSRGDIATCNALPMAYNLPIQKHLQLSHVHSYSRHQLRSIISDASPISMDSGPLLEQYAEMLSLHGNFVQARLQVLLLQRDPGDNLDAKVRSMKSSLSLQSTYMQIYARILAQDKGAMTVALATLSWLLYGNTSNEAELLRLVSVTTERQDLDIEVLEKACLGMVSFVNLPSFIHGSALEFLKRQYLLSPAHVLPKLAMTCLDACSSAKPEVSLVELYAYVFRNVSRLCELADEYHNPALLSQLTHYLKYDLTNSDFMSRIAFPSAEQDTPLLVAAHHGLVSILETWQWSTHDMQVTTRSGESALHLACRAGHSAAAMILIHMGCDVNAKTDANKTPFSYASEGGHVQVCRMLLENGVELNWADSITLKAYTQSCKCGNEQISLLLLQHTDGLTEALPQLWHITMTADSVSLLETLLDYGSRNTHADIRLPGLADSSSRVHKSEVLTMKQCFELSIYGSDYGHSLTTTWLLQRLIDEGFQEAVVAVLQSSVEAQFRYLYLAPMRTESPYHGLGSSAGVVRRILTLAKSGHQHRSKLLKALLGLSMLPQESQDSRAVFRAAIACGDLETADVLMSAGECIYSNDANAFLVALRGCEPHNNIFTALDLYSRSNTNRLGHDQSYDMSQPKASMRIMASMLDELLPSCSYHDTSCRTVPSRTYVPTYAYVLSDSYVAEPLRISDSSRALPWKEPDHQLANTETSAVGVPPFNGLSMHEINALLNKPAPNELDVDALLFDGLSVPNHPDRLAESLHLYPTVSLTPHKSRKGRRSRRSSLSDSTTSTGSSSRSVSPGSSVSDYNDILDTAISDMEALIPLKSEYARLAHTEPAVSDIPAQIQTVPEDAFEVIFAAASNHHHVLDVMITHREVFGLTDDLLRFALFEAVRAGHCDTVHLLFSRTTFHVDDARSALAIATVHNHEHVIDDIIDHSQLPIAICIETMALASQSAQSCGFIKAQQLTGQTPATLSATIWPHMLAKAAQCESAHILKFIVGKYDIEVPSLISALLSACKAQRAATISLLLNELAKVTDTVPIVRTMLGSLAQGVDVDSFMCLVTVAPMSVSELIASMLQELMEARQCAKVRKITRGRSPAAGIDGTVFKTALFQAINCGQASICRVLLETGLEINAPFSNDTRSPIQVALEELAKCVDKQGCDSDSTDQLNDIVRALFDHGARLSEGDASKYLGDTVTIAAPAVVRSLLRAQTSVQLSHVLSALRRESNVFGIVAMLLKKCRKIPPSSYCWDVIIKEAARLLRQKTYDRLSDDCSEDETDTERSFEDDIKEDLLASALYCLLQQTEDDPRRKHWETEGDQRRKHRYRGHDVADSSLLIYGDDIDWTVMIDKDDYAVLLMHSVVAGEDEAVAKLIARDADVDWKDPLGITALHLACEHSRRSICRKLLRACANSSCTDDAGRTPLSIARDADDDDIVAILEKHGASAGPDKAVRDMPEDSGLVKVRRLVQEHDSKSLKKILNDETDRHCLGEILIYACKEGNSTLIETALQAGADVNYLAEESEATSMRDTPLRASIESNTGRSVLNLLSHGADPTTTFENSTDTITLAIRRNLPDCVSALLSLTTASATFAADEFDIDALFRGPLHPAKGTFMRKWTYPARIIRSACHEASLHPDRQFIELLIESGVKPTQEGFCLSEVFTLADERSDPEILRAWLQALARHNMLQVECCKLPDPLPKNCLALLHVWLEYLPCTPTLFLEACVRGHKSIVEIGLQDVSPSTEVDGCPALHFAAAYGRVSIVELLLEHGALAEIQHRGRPQRRAWDHCTFGSPIRTAIEGCLLPKLIKHKMLSEEGKMYASRLARQPWTKIMPTSGPLLSYSHLQNAARIVDVLLAAGLPVDVCIGPLGSAPSMIHECKLEMYFETYMRHFGLDQPVAERPSIHLRDRAPMLAAGPQDNSNAEHSNALYDQSWVEVLQDRAAQRSKTNVSAKPSEADIMSSPDPSNEKQVHGNAESDKSSFVTVGGNTPAESDIVESEAEEDRMLSLSATLEDV